MSELLNDPEMLVDDTSSTKSKRRLKKEAKRAGPLSASIAVPGRRALPAIEPAIDLLAEYETKRRKRLDDEIALLMIIAELD